MKRIYRYVRMMFFLRLYFIVNAVVEPILARTYHKEREFLLMVIKENLEQIEMLKIQLKDDNRRENRATIQWKLNCADRKLERILKEEHRFASTYMITIRRIRQYLYTKANLVSNYSLLFPTARPRF